MHWVIPWNRIWPISLSDSWLAVLNPLQLNYLGMFHWTDETYSTTASIFRDKQFRGHLHIDIPYTLLPLSLFSVRMVHSLSAMPKSDKKLIASAQFPISRFAYHYHPKFRFRLEKQLQCFLCPHAIDTFIRCERTFNWRKRNEIKIQIKREWMLVNLLCEFNDCFA